jgi:hypothetical protein
MEEVNGTAKETLWGRRAIYILYVQIVHNCKCRSTFLGLVSLHIIFLSLVSFVYKGLAVASKGKTRHGTNVHNDGLFVGAQSMYKGEGNDKDDSWPNLCLRVERKMARARPHKGIVDINGCPALYGNRFPPVTQLTNTKRNKKFCSAYCI